MKSYIHIDGWRSNIRFSSAHIIPEYEKCGRLHGHSYAVHIKIFGKPDEKGIIIDFTVVKKVLKDVVEKLDHKVLIPEKNDKVNIEKKEDSVIIFSNNKKYVIPVGDCVFLPILSTSAENIASYLLERVIAELYLSSNVERFEVGVDEGFGQGAWVFKDV